VALWSYIRHEKAVLVFNSIMQMTGELGRLYRTNSETCRSSNELEPVHVMFVRFLSIETPPQLTAVTAHMEPRLAFSEAFGV